MLFIHNQAIRHCLQWSVKTAGHKITKVATVTGQLGEDNTYRMKCFSLFLHFTAGYSHEGTLHCVLF
jgi:hypothetical protein